MLREKISLKVTPAAGGSYHCDLLTQLARAEYLEFKKVVAALGGRWDGRKKTHVFPDDPTEGFDRWVRTGHLPPKNPTAFFPTPKDLADELAGWLLRDRWSDGWADVLPPPRILEPSAGDGALARAIRDRTELAELHCIELDAKNRRRLAEEGFDTIAEDFLEVELKSYDMILMNPPFNGGEWMRHVEKAMGLLKPNGVMVGVAPAGLLFRADAADLRNRIASSALGAWEREEKKFGDAAVSVVTFRFGPARLSDEEARHFIALAIENDRRFDRFLNSPASASSRAVFGLELDAAIGRHIQKCGGCVRWTAEDREWAIEEYFPSPSKELENPLQLSLF